MLVYQRVHHGISLNGRVSEKGRVIRPTCRRNPDECGNDHADFPCYTDIAGPSSYKLAYSPKLTPSKYSYMLCHVIYPPLSPVFVDTNQPWLSNGGPYCTTRYCQMWHSTTQKTVAPPRPWWWCCTQSFRQLPAQIYSTPPGTIEWAANWIPAKKWVKNGQTMSSREIIVNPSLKG